MKTHILKLQVEDEQKAALMVETFTSICSLDGNYWSGELTGEKSPEGWYIAHIKEGQPDDRETETICRNLSR